MGHQRAGVTTDLSDADCALLRRVAAGDGDPEPTDGGGGGSDAGTEERLSRLADDGLVRRAAGKGEGEGYELTPSGRRALRARGDDPTGDADDLPGTVESDLAALELRPDERAAVRRAVAFLRDWNAATAAEVVDAVYAEAPAGRDDPEEWWDGLVRERLAGIAGVVPPDGEQQSGSGPRTSDGDGAAPDREWRYDSADDRPSDATDADAHADGRRVIADDQDRYGSAKHAIEREAADDREAEALSAAFEALAERGDATDDDLAAALDGRERGPDAIADALAALPGVERDDGRWRYAPPDREAGDAGGRE